MPGSPALEQAAAEQHAPARICHEVFCCSAVMDSGWFPRPGCQNGTPAGDTPAGDTPAEDFVPGDPCSRFSGAHPGSGIAEPCGALLTERELCPVRVPGSCSICISVSSDRALVHIFLAWFMDD